MDPIQKVVGDKTKKLSVLPYATTQLRQIEVALCSIHWLLLSKGYEGLPLKSYIESMHEKFEGHFLPTTLCTEELKNPEFIKCFS